MAGLECKFTVPRRQAMLSIGHLKIHVPEDEFDEYRIDGFVETERVPVFVWPIPTERGDFIVEHQTGKCETVNPNRLTFLNSKEIFDQYDWS